MDRLKHNIRIKPGNEEISAEQDRILLKLLQEEGYLIQSICGGEGICGKCWVQIKEGAPEPTEADRRFFNEKDLADGIRLSCMTKVVGDMVIQIPSLDQPVGSKELMNKSIRGLRIDPGIEKVYLELSLPGRADQLPDAERITKKLDRKVYFPHRILKKLPSILRKSDFKVTVTVNQDSRILSVEPGDHTQDLYGIALDIGTTTVATYILNLTNGKELEVHSFENPQAEFGADVISRIKHVHKWGEKGLRDLQTTLLEKINLTLEGMCTQTEINCLDIVRSTVVGNPTMLHLFAGIDPTNIDHSPYIPAFKSLTTFSAQNLELAINPLGKSYLLPQVSAYVGADITAGILYTQLHKSDSLKLLIDIGTNGEIVLGNKERIMAASTAAGPAFEGAGIKQGMSARPGAINRVKVENDLVKIEVIGDEQPRGICGSGLVDAVGQLLKIGLIDTKGSLKSEQKKRLAKKRLEEIDSQLCFNLSDKDNPVRLGQKDIRELQLAKGAIRAGIEILLEEMGATGGEIDEVYLAGAFGNYLEAENVLRLGLIPPKILEAKVISAGNTAGQGAKLCLINKEKINEIGKISDRIEYVELSYRSDFSEKFMQAMRFPPQKTLS